MKKMPCSMYNIKYLVKLVHYGAFVFHQLDVCFQTHPIYIYTIYNAEQFWCQQWVQPTKNPARLYTCPPYSDAKPYKFQTMAGKQYTLLFYMYVIGTYINVYRKNHYNMRCNIYVLYVPISHIWWILHSIM